MFSYREILFSQLEAGGRVERWCWVNLQCRGVLLIWIIVGQGPTALAIGAGGVVWTFFSLIYLFSFLLETTRYRLKYCLKGPLSPKQPTNSQLETEITMKNTKITIIIITFNHKT